MKVSSPVLRRRGGSNPALLFDVNYTDLERLSVLAALRDPISREGGGYSRQGAKPQRVVVNYTDLERLSVLAALRDPISRGEEYSSR